MLATEVIAKKRDSQPLTAGEIQFMITGMLEGSIPDYQISSWAMAILCRGMNAEETAALTECMLASGQKLCRSSDKPRVDKHSTGGLGDKVSLILAPLLACFDVDVPMLSGRGLGITGGTLDKLECYPGFRCDLSEAEIENQMKQLNCVITGTTPRITPADRKLYGLRDVTGTVPSIALITASILSKKLAETLDALVLDVKFGSGAFMTNQQLSRQLAQSLQNTAQKLKLNSIAVLSDMNQPSGRMVGNACEANEAVQVLQGTGPSDVRRLTLRLSAELLVAVGVAAEVAQATAALETCLDGGQAYERYQEMIRMQGGSFSESIALEADSTLESPQDGWVESIDGQTVGHAVIRLGGGRRVLGDQLNHLVGLEFLVRVGDKVIRGQPLITVFSNTESDRRAVQEMLLAAIRISPTPTASLELFAEA